MPLFGTEIVEVTTPDGRRVKLPAQLAAGFSGLQPVPQPEPDPVALPSAPAPPEFTPQDRLDIAGDAAAGPVTLPGQSPAGNPAQPRGPVTLPAQLDDPGPPQQQPTPEIPTAGAALAGEQGAIDQQQKAVTAAAQIEADRATAEGEALAARNEQVDQILVERERVALENKQALDERMLAYDREAKAIANTKIDRGVDHPILAAISVALGGIGSAMKGESGNPALDMLLKQIDRKVQGQMADLDSRRAGLAIQREGINDQRSVNRDKLAEYDVRRDAAIQQAQRKIEEIGTRSGSDLVKARAQQVNAGLEGERAKTAGTYAEREQQRIERDRNFNAEQKRHQQNLGLGYAQLDMSREKLQAEREIEAAKLAAKGQTDRAKLVLERGMGGEVKPVLGPDGKPVLDENGQPKVEVGLMTDKKGNVWIPNGNETTITTLQKQHTATLQLVGTLDQIRKLGPEWLLDTRNSDKLQQLKQLMANATLQAIAAKELGVPTGRDIEFAQGMIGTNDPTRWKDSIAGIEEGRKSLVRDHAVRLRTANYDKDWSPPDLGNKGSTEAPGDSDLKSMQRAPNDSDWSAALGGPPKSNKRTYKGEPVGDAANPKAKAWVAEHGEILPRQIDAIDQHAAALKSDNMDARKKAGAWLEQVAKTGGTKAIRAYASQAFTNAVPAYIGESAQPEPVAGSSRSVARETVPPVRQPAKSQPKQRRDSAGNPY